MVSEDSQELRRLPVIHRLGDLGDVSQPVKGQMTTFLHQFDNGRELLEVLSFCSSQRMLTEERDNPFSEVFSATDFIPQEILLVVVVSTIQINPTAVEEINEIVQDLSTGSSLDNGEGRLDLPAESHLGALDDRGAKAPFAIDEPDDPSNVLESFLLVSRRGTLYATRHRIVTAHNPDVPERYDRNERVPDGCTGFPSI